MFKSVGKHWQTKKYFFNQELENISEHLTALCINVHSLQCLFHIFASFFAYGAVINGLPNIMEEGRAS